VPASGGHQNFECSSQFQRFRRLESIITVLDERQDSRRRQQGARAGVCSACGVRRLPTRRARVWCSGSSRARAAARAGSGAAARCGQQAGMARQ